MSVGEGNPAEVHVWFTVIWFLSKSIEDSAEVIPIDSKTQNLQGLVHTTIYLHFSIEMVRCPNEKFNLLRFAMRNLELDHVDYY